MDYRGEYSSGWGIEAVAAGAYSGALPGGNPQTSQQLSIPFVGAKADEPWVGLETQHRLNAPKSALSPQPEEGGVRAALVRVQHTAVRRVLLIRRVRVRERLSRQIGARHLVEDHGARVQHPGTARIDGECLADQPRGRGVVAVVPIYPRHVLKKPRISAHPRRVWFFGDGLAKMTQCLGTIAGDVQERGVVVLNLKIEWREIRRPLLLIYGLARSAEDHQQVAVPLMRGCVRRIERYGFPILRLRRAEIVLPHQLSRERPGAVPRHALTDALKRLLTCIGRLEPDRQRMLLLAYYGAFSREQLSLKLDMPADLLKDALRRSLIEVEECLKT